MKELCVSECATENITRKKKMETHTKKKYHAVNEWLDDSMQRNLIFFSFFVLLFSGTKVDFELF
jgi:hypothetical protein